MRAEESLAVILSNVVGLKVVPAMSVSDEEVG